MNVGWDKAGVCSSTAFDWTELTLSVIYLSNQRTAWRASV